eukprot:6036614-Karenia_brevis.AAC.1
MTERRPLMPWVVAFTKGVLTDRAAHAVVLPTYKVTPTPQGMQVHLPLSRSHLPPDQVQSLVKTAHHHRLVPCGDI